jgi:pimeloyl-ACP methyl ester carboxylesterase
MREKITMNTIKSKDGTKIAYDQLGSGPALVLVSGATATRAAAQEAAEYMADHFTIFSYDRRGRGDSGDTPPYAVEREIEDLEAMIDAAGGSAFVFGHSSGAVLALRAAGKLSNKVKKLAIYEPPFIIDDSRPPLPKDYVEHLNELIAAGRKADTLEYFMTVAVNIPAEYIADMKQAPMWESATATAHTIPYDGQIMGDTMGGNPAALEQFATITTPTLVMDGGQSPPFMHNGAETLAKILPNAQHRRLAGQDHGAAPEALNPVLIEFLLGR